LAQDYYGMGDTVLARDTTAWFAFTTDTCWQFLHGAGKYRLLAQAKDSTWNTGEFVADSGDTFVWFDSVPPVGSISIADGARFVTACSCTVAVAVADSVSGAYRMRLGAEEPMDLSYDFASPIANEGWQVSGGAYDGPLQMVRLDVDSGVTSTARRMVPESPGFEAFFLDTFHLSGDFLVTVPGGEASSVGVLALRYLHVEDEDTTWEDVVELAIPGGREAYCALSCLDTAFVLPVPDDPQGYWRGGALFVEVTGPDSAGKTVWFDNVRLEPASPYPSYSWWTGQDSLAEWELASGSGWRVLYGAFQDSAGTETRLALIDSVIVDAEPPEAGISSPRHNSVVSGTVVFIGRAYDSIIVTGDTFFEWRRLQYRHIDSTGWLPTDPDSVSYSPVWGGGGATSWLGNWNTTTVANGLYKVRLVVRDSAGNQTPYEVPLYVMNRGMDGGEGEEPLEADGPSGGGASLGAGSVWVGSQSGLLAHYDEDLVLLDTVALGDTANEAWAVAVLELPDDSILVADARQHTIVKLSRAGTNRRAVATGFGLVAGMALDEDDRLWVLDRGASELYRCASDGSRELTLGGAAADSAERLSGPEGLATREGRVYVADTRHDRVAVWDTAGTWLGDITGGFSTPQAVAVMTPHQLYIIDKTEGTIEGINSLGGRFLTLDDAYGRAYRQALLSADSDYVYTLRPQDNKVVRQRVRVEPWERGGEQAFGQVPLPERCVLYQPWPNPARRMMHVRYGLPRTTRVSLKVYDITGRECRRLVSAEQRPGYYNLAWDGTDDRGRTLAQGVYFVSLVVEDGPALRRKVVLAR